MHTTKTWSSDIESLQPNKKQTCFCSLGNYAALLLLMRPIHQTQQYVEGLLGEELHTSGKRFVVSPVASHSFTRTKLSIK